MIVFIVFSLALWLPASNGSKQADLGSSILSGVVVGAVLFFVGKAFNAVTVQGQTDAAMHAGPNPSPAQDDFAGAPEEVVVHVGSAEAEGHAQAPSISTIVTPPRRFRVEYEDWQRDTSRVDALQIRLRLFEGDRYFQFITIPIPAPELRRLIGADPDVTQGRVWWHVAMSVKPQLVDAIQRGEIPKEHFKFAYEVQVHDLDSAIREARRDKVHEVVVGQTIYDFEV
ncbi:MAG: hypothetical protein ACLP5O_18475 [Acidimicrobiales bacterium]